MYNSELENIIFLLNIIDHKLFIQLHEVLVSLSLYMKQLAIVIFGYYAWDLVDLDLLDILPNFFLVKI